MDMFQGLMPDMDIDMQAPAESMFPAKVSLAMAYVPFQRFENLYEPDKALSRGTLFACLDMPFHGGRERRNKNG